MEMAGLEEDHEEEIAEEKIINEGMAELPRIYGFALSTDRTLQNTKHGRRMRLFYTI